MNWLKRLFKRKPKGYRFPNGIPRVEDTSQRYSSTIPDLDTFLFGTRSDRPWVIFEDGDDK
jgi:hypothetical protein